MSEEEMKKEENIEHEVIDRLRLLSELDFDRAYLDESYIDAMLKARNIILDLYQKEKEKNKFINDVKVIGTDDTVGRRYNIEDIILKDYVRKDKIREKIKQLEKMQKEEPDAYLGILYLKELLGE